jgi:hypothetical protein
VEFRIRHVSVLIQMDRDSRMAFDSGYGLNIYKRAHKFRSHLLNDCLYLFAGVGSGLSFPWAPQKRFKTALLSCRLLMFCPTEESADTMSISGFAVFRIGPKHPSQGM